MTATDATLTARIPSRSVVRAAAVARRDRSAGNAFVLKIGPVGSTAKWNSAATAYDLATSAGIPLPRQVHFAVDDDRVVRT